MGALSADVFGCEFSTGVSDFCLSDGYHQIKFDRVRAQARFAAQAPCVLDRILEAIPDLAREMANAIIEGYIEYIGSAGELSWLTSHQGHLFASIHISAKRKSFVLAHPGYSIFKNVDSQPLTMAIVPLNDSFERVTEIDTSQAKEVKLLPGEQYFSDGFAEILWFKESGINYARLSTLPLGAYEASYAVEGGKRVGLFSTDLRLSSTEVVLRTMAAAGWPEAGDLARRSAAHPLKELRWASLNYAWRTDVPDLLDALRGFADDSDPGIRQLATQCLAQLQQAGPAAEEI